MPGKKWLIVLGCSAAVLLLWLFRTPILLRLCPGAVLFVRTQKTLQILEERYGNNPLTWLEDTLPDTSKANIQAVVEYAHPDQGLVTWNVDLKMQSFPPRMAGEGRFGTSGQPFSLSFYLDENCAAICPSNIQEGGWYGVAYEPFLKTLQENKSLELVLGNSGAQLRKWMATPDKIPVIPRVSVPTIPWEQLRSGAVGLLALPYQVSRTEEGYWLYTEFTGKLLERFLAYIPGCAGPGEKVKISGNFFLQERGISSFYIVISEESQKIQISGILGQDMSRDEMKLELLRWKAGNKEILTMTVGSRREEGERGSITNSSAECLDWYWDPQSVQLTLVPRSREGDACASMVLHSAPDGICISTSQTGYLLEELIGLNIPHADRWGEGEFVIQEGTGVAEQRYLDFSQWSMEELLRLLESVDRLPLDFWG